MEFLAPHLLWSLPLAGLPLLLYWSHRQQAEEMDYPSLAWLDDSFRERLQKTKQQRWLQVLWRMFLILLLIYLLSQPIIGRGTQSADRTVVLIDNSMSMEQTNVGQTALDASGEWLIDRATTEGAINPSTRIGVVLPEPRFLAGGNQSVEELLSTVSTQPGQPNLRRIRRWVANQFDADSTRVILLTDAQESLFRGDANGSSNVTIEIKTPFSPPDNVTLTDGRVRPTPQFVDQTARISWRSRPTSVRAKRVTVGGDHQFVPDHTDHATWTPNQIGQRPVNIELRDDGLDWDNHYRFVASVRGSLRVHTIGQSRALNAFVYTLSDHVTTVDDPDRADLIIMGTNSIPDDWDETVFDDATEETPKFILADQQFNRRSFARLDGVLDVPWQIDGLVERDEPGFPTITNRRWFQAPGSDVTDSVGELSIQSFYRIESTNNGETLLGVGGEPLLARQDQWFMLTAPSEQFISPGTATTSWPRLLLRIVRGIAQSPSPENGTVGQPLTPGRSLSYPVTVTPPSGDPFQLNSRDDRWVPGQPGFYQLTGADGNGELRAVNYNPEEGDLSRLSPAEWPDNTIPYREQDHSINLALSPWLWLLFLVGLCVDVWWDNQGVA